MFMPGIFILGMLPMLGCVPDGFLRAVRFFERVCLCIPDIFIPGIFIPGMLFISCFFAGFRFRLLPVLRLAVGLGIFIPGMCS